jgi:hypothetical protein
VNLVAVVRHRWVFGIISAAGLKRPEDYQAGGALWPQPWHINRRTGERTQGDDRVTPTFDQVRPAIVA